MANMNIKTINYRGEKVRVRLEICNWICDGKEGWCGTFDDYRSWEVKTYVGGHSLGRFTYGVCTNFKYRHESGREYVNDKRAIEGEFERWAQDHREEAEDTIIRG